MLLPFIFIFKIGVTILICRLAVINYILSLLSKAKSLFLTSWSTFNALAALFNGKCAPQPFIPRRYLSLLQLIPGYSAEDVKTR